MQFGGLFYAIMTLFKHIKLLLDAFISSNTFLCTWTIKIINYSVIKCPKNGAKMNKIVQKWQFWMTFYTTMKMEVGISLNGPNKWFPPYWFLIAQHMKYPKIIMRAPVHFFWVVTTLGLQWQADPPIPPDMIISFAQFLALETNDSNEDYIFLDGNTFKSRFR